MSEAAQAPDETPSERLAIGIFIRPDGTCRLDGCVLGDKTMAYGLLEYMRDEVQALDAKARLSKLIKPNGHGKLDFLRGMKR